MDTAGDSQIDVLSHIHKTEVDADGKPIDEKTLERITAEERRLDFEKRPKGEAKLCRECPAGLPVATDACCNTCQDVKDAYVLAGQDDGPAGDSEQCMEEAQRMKRLLNRDNRGCRLDGYVEVNKVAGNFHFAPGHSYQHKGGSHIHEFKPEEAARFNISHTINKLMFGEYELPNKPNALDATTRISEDGPGVFQYFIKIVPTTYQPDAGTVHRTHQYAVTQHTKAASRQSGFVLPGIFFIYDINPIMVTVTEKHTPLLQFLVRLCAIVGGIFTVSGFIDAVIHNAFGASKTSPMGL